MSSQARRFVVRGRVQGVGFRHHTKLRARELGLVGWVRNLPDGSVEVVAQGAAAELGRLADFLRVGPPSARVDAVDEVCADPLRDATRFVVVGLG